MKFFIPSHGERKEDAHEVPEFTADGEAWDEFAEAAAAWAFDHMGGWEWKWPVVMAVIDFDEIVEFEVELESIPSFSATKLKEARKP